MKLKMFTTPLKWIALAALGAAVSHSQVTPVEPSAEQSDESANTATGETIKLDPFRVVSEKVGPYQASDSTSGSRVSVPLFESTKSIFVATGEVMADIGA